MAKIDRTTGANRSGELTAFVVSVEQGGFSAAARQLGVTPSAVSKLVSRLEARLGVRLLHRTTRQLHLTTEGEHLFRRGQQILAEMDEAEAEVASAGLTPRGLLRLHCGTALGLHHLVPVLPEFCRRHPAIDLELTINERRIELSRLDIDEGADLVIRTGGVERLEGDSQLVARRVCNVERVICAAPSYLERFGTPRTPDDLAGHNCLRLVDHPDLARWPFRGPDGVRTVEVSGRHAANNAETLLQMALAGFGIIRLVDALVAVHLASGALTAVLADCHHVEPVPMQLIMPRDKHRLPKVAAMTAFLLEKFEPVPWRGQAGVAPLREAGTCPGS